MPSAQYTIADEYPDSLVTVWGVNADAPFDWFGPYREQFGLTVPILTHAIGAFNSYRLGSAFGAWPPCYIILDKNGVIRHRTVGLGSTPIVEAADLIETLLEE